MNSSRRWSLDRSVRTIFGAHVPLAFAFPAYVALTRPDRPPGCLDFCPMTHAEAFALGLYVVTPATLVAGVLLGMTVNSLLHPRTRFLAWREVGVACSVTYPLLIAAFALLMATAGALDRPGIVF